MKRYSFALLVALVIATVSLAGAPGDRTVGINVVLESAPTRDMLATLGTYGTVRDIVTEINAVTMQVAQSRAAVVGRLPFVQGWNFDQERKAIPATRLAYADMSGGRSTWDLSAIGVSANDAVGDGTRLVAWSGGGVVVAVLDTGLVNNWPSYFPSDRIAVAYARSFGGGGGDAGSVSSQPNKWGEDQNSHGTHVTSTIIGYSFRGLPVGGVAPLASIIPVKVLNQNGSGWSSVIARGITYIADLKARELPGVPVVINMSLGGPGLDAMEKAAIDYAISKGVIIVASAGNEGEQGMGYPGAYAPVISVAASGWVGEWGPPQGALPWYFQNVANPKAVSDFYITDFSSRELPGQDLDVAAPGSWVLGPYQTNGQISYYFLGGTSMASPHVAGIVALMAEKKNSLTASEAEAALEASAIPLPAGCRNVLAGPAGPSVEYCWGTDATGAGLVNAAAALKLTK